MTEEAYVFEALRTPRGRGKPGGALHAVKPVDLLVGLLHALQARQRFDPAAVDDLVMGIATPVGEQGAVLPKAAALKAGWDVRCAGLQVNRFCASGLEAVNLAAQKVRSGWEDLVVAGGVESMSRVPMGSDGGAWERDPAAHSASATLFVPQGIGADLLATLDGLTRSALDAYALESQRRAGAARAAGHFARSLVPVCDPQGQTILVADEHIKPQTTLADLAALRPAFAQSGAAGFDAVALQRYPQLARVEHLHHAGNASGIVDGAAVLLIGNAAAARAHGLTPRARIVATALSGADPTVMLTGPIPATRKALARAGLAVAQIDLFEVNEAFAAVPLHFMRELGVAHDRLNVNGGAIALGHPLGATGAMLLGTLIDELHRRQLRYGLATLCVGAGMAIATIVERL